MTSKKTTIIHEIPLKKNLRSMYVICRCLKHGKSWSETAMYERFGGNACEECCNSSKREDIVIYV